MAEQKCKLLSSYHPFAFKVVLALL